MLSSVISYIDPWAGCGFFNVEKKKNLYHIYYFLRCLICFSYFYFDGYLLPASLYHWRSTSSPEENNFIHWLHLILLSSVEGVCRGATSCIFLSAGCKSTDWKASVQSVEKGRSWVLGSYSTKTETIEICKYCVALEREMEEWKIWATGVSLSGFSKWLPLGVKSSLTSAIITSIYLLMRDCWWLRLMVIVIRVIQLFFLQRNLYVNQFYLQQQHCSFSLYHGKEFSSLNIWTAAR